MEGDSSIATGLLVKAEKEEATSDLFIGSYAVVATPNFASVPLKKIKGARRATSLIRKYIRYSFI